METFSRFELLKIGLPQEVLDTLAAILKRVFPGGLPDPDNALRPAFLRPGIPLSHLIGSRVL